MSDVVMFPWSTLSIVKIMTRETGEALQTALAAPPPYKNLLAVARFDDQENSVSHIGCTAMVGLKGGNDIPNNLVAVGKQRIQVKHGPSECTELQTARFEMVDEA